MVCSSPLLSWQGYPYQNDYSPKVSLPISTYPCTYYYYYTYLLNQFNIFFGAIKQCACGKTSMKKNVSTVYYFHASLHCEHFVWWVLNKTYLKKKEIEALRQVLYHNPL